MQSKVRPLRLLPGQGECPPRLALLLHQAQGGLRLKKRRAPTSPRMVDYADDLLLIGRFFARPQDGAALLLLVPENPRTGGEAGATELAGKMLDVAVHAELVLFQTIAGLEGQLTLFAGMRSHSSVVHEMPAGARME